MSYGWGSGWDVVWAVHWDGWLLYGDQPVEEEEVVIVVPGGLGKRPHRSTETHHNVRYSRRIKQQNELILRLVTAAVTSRMMA